MDEHNPSRFRFLLKTAGVLFLICVPVILVVVVFKPFVAGKQKEELAEYSEKYSLRPGFTRNDLREVVDNMRTDYEFQYYFRVFDHGSVALAVDQIGTEIAPRMEKESFRQLLESKQAELERLGMLVENVEFSDDIFRTNDENLRPLKEALWSWLYEDFKLSVMGAIYKSTYDPSFRFHWPPQTVRAAAGLKNLFQGMRPEDLEALNRMIRSQNSLHMPPLPSP